MGGKHSFKIPRKGNYFSALEIRVTRAKTPLEMARYRKASEANHPALSRQQIGPAGYKEPKIGTNEARKQITIP